MSTTRLERIGQIAFILMCVAVSGAAGAHIVAARRPPVASKPPAPFEAGRQLELPTDATNGGTAGSLLLMLSTQCKYCTDSMPLYRRLAELPSVKSGKVRLSVISLQPKGLMREYLESHRLQVSNIFTVPEAGLAVGGTPTMVLVNERGAVAASWYGALPTDDEAGVVSAINTLAK